MSDDPTKNLPGGEGHYDTQPSITTVLERLNEIGDGLRAEIEVLRVGQEQLRVGQEQLRVELSAEIVTLRSEMNQQFAKVAEQFTFFNRKVDILTREIMDVRTKQELAEDRIDKLERKTS
jgi:phage terminase Nu1 subunit (DNA packaging protein)